MGGKCETLIVECEEGGPGEPRKVGKARNEFRIDVSIKLIATKSSEVKQCFTLPCLTFALP